MVCCSVYGCNNNHRNKALTFFRFPKDENLMKQWTWACRRKDSLNMKTARVCSIHFQESDHYKSLKYELLGYTPKRSRKLKLDAVPSLHLPKKTEPNLPVWAAQRINKGIVKNGYHKLAAEVVDSNTSTETRAQSDQEAAEQLLVISASNNIGMLVDHSGQHNTVNINVSNELGTVSKTVIESGNASTSNQDRVEYSSLTNSVVVEQNPEFIIISYDETDPTTLNSKDRLISTLVNENRELRTELKNLKKHLQQMNNDRQNYVREILKPMFTEGQIRCLLQDFRKKKIHWSAEDLAAANTLMNVSASAYRHLRDNLNFPLPAASTLRRCTSVNNADNEKVVEYEEIKSNEIVTDSEVVI